VENGFKTRVESARSQRLKVNCREPLSNFAVKSKLRRYQVVTNAVSVDYLTRPLEMMKEVNRVLKPGGLAAGAYTRPLSTSM
jgi:hypothetical protein